MESSADEGARMRLATDEIFARASAKLAALRDRMQGYRADMLDHPVAGACLRNYAILTEDPGILQRRRTFRGRDFLESLLLAREIYSRLVGSRWLRCGAGA